MQLGAVGVWHQITLLYISSTMALMQIAGTTTISIFIWHIMVHYIVLLQIHAET